MTKLDVDLNRYFSSLLNTLEVFKFLWQKKIYRTNNYFAEESIFRHRKFILGMQIEYYNHIKYSMASSIY